ncbi:MAG: pyruvate ferredoxin oxidoreductase, partial [Candidatus Liptonbacteria bacterium]|nr:pyruvate ferredoxin oxidoreductase [Candidatus Liptonbacteria bacterium]
HGEFTRLVIAPGDPEESFRAGADAMNLAWKYQIPVIVLLDKHVSENSMTSALDPGKITVEKGKVLDVADNTYKRYAMAGDGVSPMAFPGTANAVIKCTSYEHDEYGIATEEIPATKAMQEKRFMKSATLRGEFKNFETIKVYGDPESKNVVVFWGSVKAPILEAAKHFKSPVKLLQILWLEPFDAESVSKQLSGAEKIVGVENNHDAQLAGLIREKTGIHIQKTILRYDSAPFDLLELAGEINKLISQ